MSAIGFPPESIIARSQKPQTTRLLSTAVVIGFTKIRWLTLPTGQFVARSEVVSITKINGVCGVEDALSEGLL